MSSAALRGAGPSSGSRSAAGSQRGVGRAPISPGTEREPLWVLGLKALLLMAAAALYLFPMSTLAGLWSAVGMVALAAVLARRAAHGRLRTVPGALLGVLILAAGLPVGRLLSDSSLLALALDARRMLMVADGVQFGLVAFGLTFAMRFLAVRRRPFAFVEAAFVVGSVAYTFARHRNHMISRPRFFADWAWSMGYDPQAILQGLGVAVAAVATLLLLRRQRPAKLLVTSLLLALMALLVYRFVDRAGAPATPFTNGLGLTDKDKANGKGGVDGDLFEPGDADGSSGGGKGDGKGGGKGGGKGKGGGGGNPPPPTPVAVAIFSDDYDPPGGILYFRQQVLSRFDGSRLVASTDARFDTDVITRFPGDAPVEAVGGPEPDFHQRVPTTMFLLHDHPQPLALAQSVRVEHHDNPAPRRFVAAYNAISLTLSTGLDRLLGRASVPMSWDTETRTHYLAFPADPRYVTLADEILRDQLDPRLAGDDIAKALVIKGWLEKHGFYTRKERHAGVPDPAGDFLFGNRRGYCVHFAHAFAHLMRSQGIAARVALGYAVDTRLRGNGSAVLIMGDRAHAWPEIHIEGVGWVPFDIYPERSDEQGGQFVDQSLENLLGEIARNDPTGGRGEDPDARLNIPWGDLLRGLLWALLAALVLNYGVKIGRRLRPRLRPGQRAVFVAVLDRLADAGAPRRHGETRERYAARMAAVSPSLDELTGLHLRAALGGQPPPPERLAEVARRVDRELARNLPLHKRFLALLNPVGWWFSR